MKHPRSGHGGGAPSLAVVYFGNPQSVPPVLNIIRRLAQEYRVALIARNEGTFDYPYPENVTLHRIGHAMEREKNDLSLAAKILDQIRFVHETAQVVRKERASLLFAFDLHAMVAACIARWLSGRPMGLLYHQNELQLREEIPPTRLVYWLKLLELRMARSADLLSFPEANRARLFLEEARVVRDVVIMENCPPRLAQLPDGAPELRELQARGRRIVMYQGAIGPGIEIDLVIRSIKYWPPEAVFVLVGRLSAAWEQEYRRLAGEEGVSERMVFVPFIRDYTTLLRHTTTAEAGLVLYRPDTVNTRYAAPNKLYEYLACGVPVVVPGGLRCLSEAVDRMGVGVSYAHSTAEEIGKAIRTLLMDPERHAVVSRARAAHLASLNFEEQFEPVLQAVRRAIGSELPAGIVAPGIPGQRQAA